MATLVEIEEVVSTVEERFRRAYDPIKSGEAKVESQMEYEQVSTGWWLVIRRLGIALRVGKEKPPINSGDRIVIDIKTVT